MNPFDWTGPPFLLFYAVLAAAVILIARILRDRRELVAGGHQGTPIHDPYAIAFLRGGRSELVRVAVVAMVDRGLLVVEGDRVRTSAVGLSATVRRRIEQDLLVFCASGRTPQELFVSAASNGAAAEVELELSRMRLLPDEEMKSSRRKLFVAGAAVLLFFSVVKIGVALSRGRTNVGFLILFTLIALGLLARYALTGRTARGDAFLRELANLFHSLKLRAAQLHPGGATSEVAMLAAVWGVSALPHSTYPWSRQLFPKAASSDGGTSVGSCGSSCGSGCGGGCGGGGCGGCGG